MRARDLTLCLFCGGDRNEPDHGARCDGRQGWIEAEEKWRFDGDDYVPPRDNPRLGQQYDRIFALMRDAVWRSLSAIERATGDPPASISAQLRHMRKRRFGGHTVNRRYLGEGLYEYQLIANEGPRSERGPQHHAKGTSHDTDKQQRSTERSNSDWAGDHERRQSQH